jgi:hypothetical protein
MQVNILHDGALTVELESNGTVTSHIAGACPTLDDIARQRAQSTYMVPEELTFEQEYDNGTH